MKNVLFLCGAYYRNTSPNGICVKEVADKLNNDNNVKVITFFSDVSQLKEEIIDNINVYRVDTGLIQTNLYKNFPQKTKKQRFIYKSNLKLSKLNGLLHAFKYPLLSRRKVNNMYKKAKELYNQNAFDYVVCAYHQIADVLAGIKLKKKYPNIKLVLYSLDAISGGLVPTIMNSKKIPMNSLKRWERYFFKHIDKLFAMESHRGYYESNSEYNKYSNKIEYLDIPLLLPRINEKHKNDSTIKLVFTGSMHKDTANPEYLLKILDKLENIQVDIYGNVGEEIKKQIQSHSDFNNKIFLRGAVSHDEIFDIQSKADVLLNFGNANPNMIPCKIFEYMSTGNKILSFTHSEKDSSLPYIEKYPNGLIVEESDNKIAENIEKIKDFINSTSKQISVEELNKLFAKNTPKYFAEKLFEV